MLKEHPDYAVGRMFAFECTPVHRGDYSVRISTSNGFTTSHSEWTYYVYELEGGIVAVSDQELPETGCSGVRGSWGPVPYRGAAVSGNIDLPLFVLHISQARVTATEWR